MSTFRLEIITPEKIAFQAPVDYLSVPSKEGVLGILAGHEPLFSLLSEGELKISAKGEETFLAIGGGYLEVTRDKVVVLVSNAVKADEINEQEVLNAKKRAEEALEQKPEGEALIDAQAMFRRSQIALKVLKRRKRVELS